MTGRVCQLCGKPLSRIWAGSGGDFCSREHRSQYRLRCGMDTLLEANKHASLMRRRDNLRQFPPASLRCASDLSPRAFGAAAPQSGHPALRRMAVSVAPLHLRLDIGSSDFLTTRAPGELSGRNSVRRFATAQIAKSRRPLPVPIRAPRLRSALTAAGTVPLRSNIRAGAVSPRGVLLVTWKEQKAAIPPQAFRALAPNLAGGLAGRRGRKLKISGKVGNAYRISGKVGFAIRATHLRKVSLAAPAAHAIETPGPRRVPRKAAPGRSITPHAARQEFPLAGAFVLESKGIRRFGQLRGGDSLPLPARPAYQNRPETWEAVCEKNHHDKLVLCDFRIDASRSSSGRGYAPIKLTASGIVTENKVGRAPFKPEEPEWIEFPYVLDNSR